MKRRTDLAHVHGFVEVDIYIGDLVVFEKSKDILGRAVGSRGGGSVGGDADPDGDGTDNRLSLAFFVVLVVDIFVLNDILKTNDVDGCEKDLKVF